ncbi:MAG TPA: helix-hairpin-helix domain-containing protein [Rubricoccaceae bacterium]|nr:helix-hairpin-helix domain-containing protein [Rubricoccaceae bacterium]
MRGSFALCLLSLSSVLCLPAAAQVAPDTTDVAEQDVLEPLAEEEPAGDPEVLADLLADLRESPLDVNQATAEDLAQIPSLGLRLADAIVRYREANGLFGSLPELQLVEAITPEVYAAARPYLTIGETLATTARTPSRFPPVPTARTVFGELRTTLTQRLQRRLDLAEGFRGPDSARAYPGGPERVYTRINARYRRNVSFNVTLEKDPGERFAFEGESPGYDFASAHLGIARMGRIDALIVGDFTAEFGQGLTLWRPGGFGKGPEATRGPLRAGRGLRPYGSTDENRFFRGAGATLALTPDLYASVFASRRRLDATLDSTLFEPDDPDLPAGFVVTGLGETGLHRTASERARKDALGETLVGGAFEVRRLRQTWALTAGIVGYRARFDEAFVPGTRPDEFFDFEGQTASMAGAYADLRVRGVRVFSEAARAPGGAVGALSGVAADVGPAADVLVLARHYPRDFVTLHGYPFGERNGVGQNETGLYLGARVRPTRQWSVAAYLDQYRFPWLRFGVPRPSRGHEALGFVEFRPRRWLRLYAQGRHERREEGTDVPGEIPGTLVGGLVETVRQSLRLHGEYEASRRVRLRARVEGVRFVEVGSEEPDRLGVLLYQDVRYSALRWLRLDARLTLFDTEGFDARVYQFENDLTGVFAVPVLSGRGVRAYALLTAEPVEGLTLQAKLAATRFRNVRRVSSGNDEIEGDTVRDLGLQLRYTF